MRSSIWAVPAAFLDVQYISLGTYDIFKNFATVSLPVMLVKMMISLVFPSCVLPYGIEANSALPGNIALSKPPFVHGRDAQKAHAYFQKRGEELKSKKKLSKRSRRNAGGSDDSNQKGFLAGDCPESTRASAVELDLGTASLLEAVTLSQSCWGL